MLYFCIINVVMQVVLKTFSLLAQILCIFSVDFTVIIWTILVGLQENSILQDSDFELADDVTDW